MIRAPCLISWFPNSGNDHFRVFNYSLPPGGEVFPALLLNLGPGNDFAHIDAVWDHSFVVSGTGVDSVLMYVAFVEACLIVRCWL